MAMEGTSEIINLLKLLAKAGSTPMRSNSNSIGLLSIRLMFSTLIRFDRFSTTFFFAFLPSRIEFYKYHFVKSIWCMKNTKLLLFFENLPKKSGGGVETLSIPNSDIKILSILF